MATAVLESLTSDPEASLPATPAKPAAAAKSEKPRRRALIVLPVLVALAAGSAGIAYVNGRGKETTDDAQIEGHVASVAPRVAGQVKSVLVRDNQAVKTGDVLVELDDRELVAKLDAAKADLAAAEAQLLAARTALAVTEKTTRSSLSVARGGLAQAAAVRGTTHAAIEQAKAAIVSAESRRGLAATELSRTHQLFETGAVSRADYDSRKADLEQAEASLTEATARLSAAQANIDNSHGTLEAARGQLIAAEAGPEQVEAARAQVELAAARVKQARAALEQAELNLSYTRITAQVSGVVARRSVEVGQLASPDRPLLAIVPLDDTWVVANFKEDQIAEMQPGEAALVKVDSFEGHAFTGHVDSLAGGTGARFALLPPDNASGNFTKVVQRVPVLVRLDPHPGFELRPGLSATATVYTK